MLHPDGLRIVVSELNTTAFGLPTTLSPSELMTIAVSDDWKA